MASQAAISVLHVDDDLHLAELTAEMLGEQEWEFDVTIATSASEGLERLTAEQIDCVVSDYQMPGMNGLEFLEAVREDFPNLPFILYTGKGSETVASDAITAGVTDYLQKETGTSQYTVLANRIRNAVEKRRHEQRAEATRTRLRKVIDLLPQLVFVKDETGEFLLANEATAEAYGTTVSNLEGATDDDFARSDEEVEQFRADDQAVINSGEPKYIPEETLTTADGDTRLLETTKIPYDPVETDGNAVLGVSMDITDRKQRERELNRTNTVLRTIVESLPMGVLVESADRDILMANDQLGDTLGVPAAGDDLVGRDCDAAAEDVKDQFADPDAFIEGITERLEERAPVQNEELALADGRVLKRDYVPYTLPAGEAHLWLYRDITERKQRERELQQQNDRLNEFAQVVSHDLKNPLNVAKGRVYMTQETCDEGQEHLEAIRSALTRMEDIIEDTLTLARQGEQVGKKTPVSVTNLTQECWASVETDEATLIIDDAFTLHGDPGRLTHIFENLFCNAIEHGGQEVTVRVGQAGEDRFYVEDDGPGVPPGDRDTIFEPGHTSTTDGTGFGLTIVKRIAEAHGWEVLVTEGRDGGARFEFEAINLINEPEPTT